MNPIAAGLLIAMSVPSLHSAQGAGEASETDIVDTAKDSRNRLTVPVRLGDHGPFRFLVDTGSQNTVVANSLVSRLALVPKSRARLIGVAGMQVVDTVEIEEVMLGRRSYYGILAPILDRKDIGAEGILGIDSLQDQRILLDFRKGLMAVNDARSLGGNIGFEIVVTARKRSGQLIMTNAKIDGITVDVVIDTGSDTTLGNRALQRAMGKRGVAVEQTLLHSVTGQTLLADVAYGNKLDMQGISITRPTIAYSDSPTFEHLKLDKRPAILLGMREMRVFPRIAIDFKARKVLFDLPDAGDPAYFGLPPEGAASPRGE
ncbi:retroviral-like aspartic protease family protein [Novosphingobium sp. TH158]|uniref:retroviral-like aspartic protease family protein n=1 Tax=Novosphingobium sp. TH158 TaxID=2067455 RepID=UPI000C7B4538|nr:retroviral-like aspartic protease family protein [Novosphingobium sp. TH158]PLK26603.1 peptidase A2A [Novosphingobium sp. TH158]